MSANTSASLRAADTQPVEVYPGAMPGDCSGHKQVVAGVGDAALASQAAHCGRMLEMAIGAEDRDLALVWQAAMYGVVNLRRARRFASGTDSGGRF